MSTPTENAAKWAANFGASGEKYAKGIMGVRSSPMEAAVAAQDRLLMNFTQAVNSGRWAKNTSAVTLQQWQTASVEKGKANIATAARVGQQKFLQADQRLAPIRESVKASLPARGTIDQNLERSRQWGLGMHRATKGG